jgi:hypothetical protein
MNLASYYSRMLVTHHFLVQGEIYETPPVCRIRPVTSTAHHVGHAAGRVSSRKRLEAKTPHRDFGLFSWTCALPLWSLFFRRF